MTQGIQEKLAKIWETLEDSANNYNYQWKGGFVDDNIRELLTKLCENVGYGNVIASASRLWRDKDPVGSFAFGMCYGTVKSSLAKTREALTLLTELQEELKPHAHEFNRTDGYGERYCQKCGEQEPKAVDGGFLDNENEEKRPNVFLQWKGTDACFDFYCKCGADCHFDGYFAYAVKCPHCGTVCQMPSILYPREIDEDGWKGCEIRILENDDDITEIERQKQ